MPKTNGRPRNAGKDKLDLAIERFTPPVAPASRSSRKGSIILTWPGAKRANFERDVISRALNTRQLSVKYEVSVSALMAYKRRYLRPALLAAAINNDIDLQQSSAAGAAWVFNTAKTTVEDLRRGYVESTDEEGNPVRMKTSERTFGSIPALLGQATEVLRLFEEVRGTIGKASAPAAGVVPQVIQVINLPKAEGTPAFAAPGPSLGPDYNTLKLIEAETEEV